MEQIPSFNSFVEKSVINHWDLDALTDYKGVTLQYKDVARKIEKLHIMFENSGVKNGGTYALVGKRGTGKTQLGVSLMGYYYIVLGKRVKYIKFIDLVDGLINDIFSRNDFVKYDLLVIDCLEVRKNSEYESREFNAIIDKRYDYPGKVTW